jgi:PPOX class F420-dependent enzyme/OxyR family protein
MRSQRLARLATVAPDGQLDVVPGGFEFDGTHVYLGGVDPEKTRKYRNVEAGNTKVALVIDDLVFVEPWSARYLRVYGTAVGSHPSARSKIDRGQRQTGTDRLGARRRAGDPERRVGGSRRSPCTNPRGYLGEKDEVALV